LLNSYISTAESKIQDKLHSTLYEISKASTILVDCKAFLTVIDKGENVIY
jgi:hypothetical protein